MFKTQIAGAVGVGVVVLGVLWWLKRQAGGDAFNPMSAGNLAYQGANGIVQWFTGDPHQTTGGAVYDAFNDRAGLADNEYSPAPGIIVTRPRASISTADREDAELGAAWTGLISNTGGAVVGRTVSRGF